MEKGHDFYFLFDHSPRQGSSSSQSGLFLYKLNADHINADNTLPLDSEPVGQPIFRFVPGKYPKGMGCGALEDKLYFFGGYFPDVSQVSQEFSKTLYILAPTSIESESSEEVVEQYHMMTRDCKSVNMLYPIVVTVKQKFFVLPRKFSAEYQIRPSIHSYEPHLDKWNSYDIFDLLKKDPAFSSLPEASSQYEVLAHCVKDCEIIVILYVGTYSFNVETGKLKLMVQHPVMPIVPFTGLAAVVDDHYFGLFRNILFGFSVPPFGPGVPPGVFAERCPCDFLNSEGLVIHLEDAEKNKNNFLLVRSGDHYGIPHVSTCLAFDFLCIQKGEEGPYCSSIHSIIYCMNKDNRDNREYEGRIIACFPMKSPVLDHSISFAAPATSDPLRKEQVDKQALGTSTPSPPKKKAKTSA